MTLEDILKSFYIASGMSMSIFDINQKIIASYPHEKAPFCKLLNKNPNAVEQCDRCDYKAMEHVKKTGDIYVYKCWCGLYDAIMPLYTYGAISGFLMMGQVKGKEEDIEAIFSKSKKYIPVSSLAQALKVLQTTSSLTKEQITSLSMILDICAKYITMTNSVDVSSENLAQEVQKYLVHHYKEEISIDFLCNYFRVSKATLINHFKKEYGTTIHKRLFSIRLNNARNLLTTTSFSVKEVALEVGFHDADYFSRAFRTFYGFSPSSAKNK